MIVRQSYISSEQGGIIFSYLAGSEMLLNAEQDRRKLSFSEQDRMKLLFELKNPSLYKDFSNQRMEAS